MPRRLILLAAALALVAAGCAPDVDSFAPDRTHDDGSRFVAHAVDVRENAGVGLGLAVDGQGTPNISYLRLDERERIPAAPIPADPQFLPAVMVASFVDGVWTRTIVAQESARGAHDAAVRAAREAGVDPPERPEFTEENLPPKLEDLGPDDTTDVAVDGQGHRHVVWTNGNREVQYAGEGEGFPSEPENPLETVTRGTVSGVSIAVGGDGVPAIAFYDGGELKVATGEGGSWGVETVAAARVQQGSRTDIAASDGGPVIAYGDGDDTMLATRGEGGWTTERVGAGGLGISLAVDEGTPVVGHLTDDGDVKVGGQTVAEGVEAPTPAGTPAPEVGAPPLPSTGVTVDAEGATWVAWSDAVGVHYAASNEDFEAREMPAAVGGANPHLAAGKDGPVAAWYAYDTTSLSGAILTEDSPELAVPSPDAEIGGGGGGGACEPEEGTELTIAAPPGASGTGFDKDCLAAPAGEAFSVAFANDDEGIPHNWTVYADESAEQSLGGAGSSASSITGPDETTYDVEGLEAGEYFFRCDLHPSTMVGTFIAAGEGGAGEESGASPTPSEAPAGGQSPGAGDPTPTTTPSG